MAEQLQLDTCMDVLVKFFKDNLGAVAGAAVAFSMPMVGSIDYLDPIKMIIPHFNVYGSHP